MGNSQAMVETGSMEIAMTAPGKGESRSLLDLAALGSMAMQHRRNVSRSLAEALDMATVNENIARSCNYTLPARKGQDADMKGPSVRLAEIMQNAWGNIVASTDSVEEHEKHVIIRGWVVDAEKMNGYQGIVRRQIWGKNGRYGEEMIAKTVQAGQSILYRNLMFRCIPRAFVNEVYDAAMTKALGGAKTLEQRRVAMLKWWTDNGASEGQILEYLGVRQVAEITMEMVEEMAGLFTAVKNKDCTVEEALHKPTREPGEEPPDDSLPGMGDGPPVPEALKRVREK